MQNAWSADDVFASAAALCGGFAALNRLFLLPSTAVQQGDPRCPLVGWKDAICGFSALIPVKARPWSNAGWALHP